MIAIEEINVQRCGARPRLHLSEHINSIIQSVLQDVTVPYSLKTCPALDSSFPRRQQSGLGKQGRPYIVYTHTHTRPFSLSLSQTRTHTHTQTTQATAALLDSLARVRPSRGPGQFPRTPALIPFPGTK